MTIYSPRLSNRLASKKQEQKHQVITFLLKQEYFCLPIEVIQKVVKMGKTYGDPQNTGISLTNYQGEELVVIDAGERIFGVRDLCKNQDTHKTRFLLVIKKKDKDIFGLPIDSPPSLMRVSESAYFPLPDIYLNQGNIHCLSSSIIQVKNKNPYFVLDINQLL